MNIFISYSARDTHRVQLIADQLRTNNNATVHWWENSHRPGQVAWSQIFQWIDGADLVLVVVSGDVLRRALAVGNEVGYAKAKNKLIIPLVWESPGVWARLFRKFGAKIGIGTDDLGCIGDLVHIKISEKYPEAGLQKLQEELQRIAAAQQDEEARRAVLALLGIVAVGALALAK
jgi:hypothetical protein